MAAPQPGRLALHPNVARVQQAGAAAGLVLEVREFPDGTRTAEDAARAIGCAVGQIVKSLVFVVDGRPVIALVSGANRLDETKLAAALGGAEVERADADVVRQATGYPIGGVPPFGHTTQLTTLVDEDLMAYDEVWAAAGTPRDVFPVSPADLVQAIGASVSDLRG